MESPGQWLPLSPKCRTWAVLTANAGQRNGNAPPDSKSQIQISPSAVGFIRDSGEGMTSEGGNPIRLDGLAWRPPSTSIGPFDGVNPPPLSPSEGHQLNCYHSCGHEVRNAMHIAHLAMQN